MRLDWTVRSLGGVALVEFRLRNDAPVDRRVRVRNCLDGPVSPPRVDRVPELGWDADGYETLVAAGDEVAGGYACPAPAAEPPVVIESVERADDADSVPVASSATPAAVVRRLGDFKPPRDATSSATISPEPTAAPALSESPEPFTSSELDDRELPDSLATWFDRVESRVERAEALTAPSVAEATDQLEALGGVDGATDLASQVDADADRLRTVAERAADLAERVERTDVPVDDLRRVA